MASPGKDVGFQISLKLEEDIATELEDLALLTRLGIAEDAMHIVENVLWHHLDHFAVVAEIIQFLIDQEDLQRLYTLIKTLQTNKTKFSGDKESLLFETIEALLVAAQGHGQKLQNIGIIHHPMLSPRRELNFDSAIELQIQEICFLAYSSDICHMDKFSDDIMRYYQYLITLDLAWDTVRLFRILCAAATNITDVIPPQDLKQIYLKLIQWINEPGSGADLSSKAEEVDQQTCRLWTRYSWLRYMDATEPMLPDSQKLRTEAHKDMTMIIEQLLENLPNPSPRGELVQYCQNLQQVLESDNEQVAQMEVEKKNLKGDLDIVDFATKEWNHEVSKLQSANSGLNLEARQLISENAQTQAQLAKFREEIISEPALSQARIRISEADESRDTALLPHRLASMTSSEQSTGPHKVTSGPPAHTTKSNFSRARQRFMDAIASAPVKLLRGDKVLRTSETVGHLHDESTHSNPRSLYFGHAEVTDNSIAIMGDSANQTVRELFRKPQDGQTSDVTQYQQTDSMSEEAARPWSEEPSD